MILNKTAVFLFSIAFLSCSLNKNIQQDEIQETYYQSWVAGVRGGGAGINFHVNLSKPFADGVVLEKLKFKGFDANFIKNGDLQYTAAISTGQNRVRQEEFLTDEVKVEKETQTPIKYDNTAILYFRNNKKTYSITIKNVKEKEMIPYPSMRKPTD